MAAAVQGVRDIQINTFDEIKFPKTDIKALKDIFDDFMGRFTSPERCGEAIFHAVEQRAGLRPLFTQARSIQAMRFMFAFRKLLNFLDKPAESRTLVEALGFQHLMVPVTVHGVVLFREAFLEVMEKELGDGLSETCWLMISDLVNYVGGAVIFIKNNYANRLKLIASSWKMVKDKSTNSSDSSDEHTEEDGHELAIAGDKADSKGGASGSASIDLFMGQQQLPTTFNDMFQINAAVMGYGRSANTWMLEILFSFDAMVGFFSNNTRIREECDILLLRLSKHNQKEVVLSEYKACMLAALRSMLPRSWTGVHEEAWVWLWDTISRLLEDGRGKPEIHEPALKSLYDSISDLGKYRLRNSIYASFFAFAPTGQSFFKQSNTRLHFIVNAVFDMTLKIYAEPAEMVSDISALGLRHVGMGIPPELFAPFVSAAVERVQLLHPDKDAMEAFMWSLDLIAKILIRTIREGSTVVMKAINVNSASQLRRALDMAPRRERAEWVLHVQVGDQFISPLMWAIETGSFASVEVMLRDLLTIRADRKKYYFGVEELFNRHPEITKTLCDMAPALLTVFLDGLVWRSQRTDGTWRRVNYYLEKLIVDNRGHFAENLRSIALTRDPNIASHEMITVVCDILWNGLIRRTFIVSRLWNIICLFVFQLNQDYLPKMYVGAAGGYPAYGGMVFNEKAIAYSILALRIFSYIVGMSRVVAIQILALTVWSRKTFRRIIAEIDQDGNGDIDAEEMKEAVTAFKTVILGEIKEAWYKIAGRGSKGGSSLKVSKGGGKSLDELLSWMLLLLLIIMAFLEPIAHCGGSPNWPAGDCAAAQPYIYSYSVFAMLAMVVHYLFLLDLAVFSTDLSTFLLVCGQVGSEIKEFCIVMGTLILMFASSTAIICDNCTPDGGIFSNVLDGAYSAMGITVSFYAGDFRDIEAEKDGLVDTFVVMFTSASQILLLNLLIAQINSAYVFIYKDMVGFAKLNRASKIAGAMDATPQGRFIRFMGSLKLDESLEFDEGDLGLAGGVQYLEAAGLNRQAVERIRRYGGTTNPSDPWPEDPPEKGDLVLASQALEDMEAMLRKALRKMRKALKSSNVSDQGSTVQGSHLSGSEHGSVLSSGGASDQYDFED